MRTNNDCSCNAPHVDCWSSRCRHDALRIVEQQRDEMLAAADKIASTEFLGVSARQVIYEMRKIASQAIDKVRG